MSEPLADLASRVVSARAALEKSADLGVTARSADRTPIDAKAITPARIALWDRYGGSMPSGWTRWLLEQYGFAHTVVYPANLDAGKLRENYDVIIFPSGAIPRPNAPITDAGATLGRVLFYERQLSVNGTVSCASCHAQASAFADEARTALVIHGGAGVIERRALSVEDERAVRKDLDRALDAGNAVLNKITSMPKLEMPSNVGGSLLPIAVEQPANGGPDTPISGASPLPHRTEQAGSSG